MCKKVHFDLYVNNNQKNLIFLHIKIKREVKIRKFAQNTIWDHL